MFIFTLFVSQTEFYLWKGKNELEQAKSDYERFLAFRDSVCLHIMFDSCGNHICEQQNPSDDFSCGCLYSRAYIYRPQESTVKTQGVFYETNELNIEWTTHL